MDKVLLTVFTSAYNRKHLLPRLYESLKSQTSFNFKWIIVDDGSADGTNDLVNKWIAEEKRFIIEYYYKENGGMFSAVNVGVEKSDTELFMNIDSDDWLPFDAVEKIEKIWDKIDHNYYVGIFGLDCDSNGNVIGKKFPENLKECYLFEYYSENIAPGDKKYIQKTEILKKVFPMVGYPGEKYFNNNVGHTRADKFGKLYVVNECFCIVEYQEGGLSKNKFKKYYKNPNNYGQQRIENLSFPYAPFKYFFKESIHFVSCYLIAGKFNKILKDSPRKWNTFFAIPFGILLGMYIIYKNKR